MIAAIFGIIIIIGFICIIGELCDAFPYLPGIAVITAFYFIMGAATSWTFITIVFAIYAIIQIAMIYAWKKFAAWLKAKYNI